MQQLLQNIRNGRLAVHEIPAPMVRAGEVLIANRASVVSAGTEKMILELSRKSLLGKARERPDHVRRVLEKVRSEGLLETVRQVREKLDSPLAMGYSSAGVVLAAGAGVHEFKPGDRVASNGPHAGIVSVPRNLCARASAHVPFDQAAFAVLGAIAMQGVRLAHVSLGETVFVIGLGLVGQLTVALLSAAGCRVLGTDLDAAKCELAQRMGAELARPGLSADHVQDVTRGLGADAVLITASTKSNGPIELAAAAVRQKGRVVLVGVVGLELDRRPFYFKEAEFVVSCSYGPGRYDPDYEERGRDYPAAHVRWTEQRNIQAVLDLMASGRLDVGPLISHRFPIERAGEAYDLIETAREPYTGIVLEYAECRSRLPGGTSGGTPDGTPRVESNSHSQGPARQAGPTPPRTIVLRPPAPAPPLSLSPSLSLPVPVGVLGAGNFARMVLLPAIRRCGSLTPRVLCSAGGVSAAHTGRKLDFERVTTDDHEVFADDAVGAVFSITRHDQHAGHVLQAIRSGKPLFVEKPLCLTLEELQEIEQALADAGDSAPLIMVGFNRRFSPAAKLVKDFFATTKGTKGTKRNQQDSAFEPFVPFVVGLPSPPLTVSIRFNAGPVPADHWTQDENVGGGRIIGEACHGIDLATYLCGSPPVRVYAESVAGTGTDDECFITLRHANGSVSNVAYLAAGDKAFPKERIEVIGAGRVAVIDDFRRVTTCARGRTRTKRLRGQDKGHHAEIAAFAEAIQSRGEAPIPWTDLRAVTAASILAVRSLREGTPLEV